MASKKLSDICNYRGLDFSGVTVYPLQRISGTTVFVDYLEHEFLPDDPPPAVVMTLPGTNRRPVKPWHMCTDAERGLELRLACMLDAVAELAVADGIIIPDIEDAGLDKSIFPSKCQRWDSFVAWYTGEESTCRIPGFGVPTLARVVFGDWEKLCAESDSSVVDMLCMSVDSGFSTKMSGGEESARFASRNISRQTSFELSRKSSNRVYGDEASKLFASRKLSSVGEGNLATMYDKLVNSADDHGVRCDLLHSLVVSMIQSRRLCILRQLWPPGPARLNQIFLFPRLGLITPKYELPPRRLRLFLSRSRESYTLKEISCWYSNEELREDDKKMIEAELQGVKVQNYLNWLEDEGNRRELCRENMLEEDLRSHHLRDFLSHQRLLKKIRAEETFGLMTDLVSSEMIEDAIRASEYGSRVFQHGSGAENEDELRELHDEIQRTVQEVVNVARAKKLKALMERKRLEELERQRIEREERDRRLEEGVARRRLLRIHLNSVIAERKRVEDDKLRMIQEEILRQNEIKRIQQEENDRLAYLQQIENKRLEECRGMALEEYNLREVLARRIEVRHMEHEDIMSYMREKKDEMKEANTEKKLEELMEIYSDFEEFKFKKCRTRKGAGLLPDDTTNNPYLGKDFFTRKKKNSKKNSKIVHLTLRDIMEKSIFAQDDLDFLNYELEEEDSDDETQENDIRDFPLFNTGGPECASFGGCVHWQGPSEKAVKAYSKVSKKPKLYTKMNSGSQEIFRVVDKNFPVDDAPTQKTLLLMGIPRGVAARAGADEVWKKKLKTKHQHLMQSRKMSGGIIENKKPFLNDNNSVNEGMENNSPMKRHSGELRKLKITTPNNLEIQGHMSPPKSNKNTSSSIRLEPLMRSRASSIHANILREFVTSPMKPDTLPFNIENTDDDEVLEKRMKGLEQNLTRKQVARIKSASEAVTRIKNERDKLVAYVESDALVQDSFYLAACMPGIRPKASVESSRSVANFLSTIGKRIGKRPSYESSMRELVGEISPPTKEENKTGHNALELDVESDVSSDTEMKTPDLSMYPNANSIESSLRSPSSSLLTTIRRNSAALNRTKAPVVLPDEPEFKGDGKDFRQVKLLPPFYRKTFGVLGASNLGVEPNPILLASQSASTLPKHEDIEGSVCFKSNKVARHRAELARLRKNTPFITTQEA